MIHTLPRNVLFERPIMSYTMLTGKLQSIRECANGTAIHVKRGFNAFSIKISDLKFVESCPTNLNFLNNPKLRIAAMFKVIEEGIIC